MKHVDRQTAPAYAQGDFLALCSKQIAGDVYWSTCFISERFEGIFINFRIRGHR